MDVAQSLTIKRSAMSSDVPWHPNALCRPLFEHRHPLTFSPPPDFKIVYLIASHVCGVAPRSLDATFAPLDLSRLEQRRGWTTLQLRMLSTKPLVETHN